MNKYLYQGKLVARQGYRDELANILADASKLVAGVKGCTLYVIGLDKNDDNAVFVTEIWDSKEDHDNSLKIEAVTALIKRAMPLLDGQPAKGRELEIISGSGI
jgi:quinol monooxygenase YgiN